MGKKWDVKRGFIKIWLIQKLGKFMQYQLRMRNQVMHPSQLLNINLETAQVSITDEKSGDAPEFKKLLSEALHNIENSVNIVVPADQLLVSADDTI